MPPQTIDLEQAGIAVNQQLMALASKTQIARDLVTLISEHYKNTR